jgi:hypothetical protein
MIDRGVRAYYGVLCRKAAELPLSRRSYRFLNNGAAKMKKAGKALAAESERRLQALRRASYQGGRRGDRSRKIVAEKRRSEESGITMKPQPSAGEGKGERKKGWYRTAGAKWKISISRRISEAEARRRRGLLFMALILPRRNAVQRVRLYLSQKDFDRSRYNVCSDRRWAWLAAKATLSARLAKTLGGCLEPSYSCRIRHMGGYIVSVYRGERRTGGARHGC